MENRRLLGNSRVKKIRLFSVVWYLLHHNRDQIQSSAEGNYDPPTLLGDGCASTFEATQKDTGPLGLVQPGGNTHRWQDRAQFSRKFIILQTEGSKL